MSGWDWVLVGLSVCFAAALLAAHVLDFCDVTPPPYELPDRVTGDLTDEERAS